MIPLKKQVCSKELAVRLRELGVEQKSVFYWHDNGLYWMDGEICFRSGREEWDGGWQPGELIREMMVSAFTVAELGEMLPRRNKYWSDKLPEEKWSNDYWCEINLIWSGKNEDDSPKNAYSINYLGEIDKRGFQIFLLDGRAEIIDENLANAMAKMLIYLIENNLYDPQTQKTQTTV